MRPLLSILRAAAAAAALRRAVASVTRLPVRWILLLVTIVIFAVSATGLYVTISERHMKLQQRGDSIANAALRVGMEFQDFETAVRVFLASPTSTNLDSVRLTYDVVYSRFDVVTTGLFGSMFNEAEAVGRLIRSLKPQVFALAPSIDALAAGDAGAALKLYAQVTRCRSRSRCSAPAARSCRPG